MAVEANAKATAMADLLGPQGSENYHAIINFMTPLAEHHVPADAWHLSIVGVHPNVQGRGLGQALLQPTLQEASSRGRVCYLETFTRRNVVFYERLGFVSIAEHAEPTTGSSYVVMRRDA
jgi:GNAT superfamily N-acetyltransferase